MKKRYRQKKYNKQKRIIIVSLFFITLSLSIGYSVFSSEINLNAKVNIKQTTIDIDNLKTKIVSSGNGLYKDYTENNRYIYKGSAPNNYIIFSDKLWRIISIESDNTIKIIKNDPLEKQVWNNTDSNDWTSASLNTYLNTTYYSTFSNTDKIITHDFNIGQIIYNNDDLSTQIQNEKQTIWNGKIGLITVSDFIKANTNVSECGNIKITNENYLKTCRYSNYLLPKQFAWTINAYSNIDSRVATLNDKSWIGNNYPSALKVTFEGEVVGYSAAYPVMFLSSDIKLKGNGSINEPYIIKN